MNSSKIGFKIEGAAILSAALLAVVCVQNAWADPFKLGVQDSTVIPSQGSYGYPAPVMVQPAQTPLQGGTHSTSMQAGTQQNFTPPPRPRPPIQAQVQKEVVLPPGYLGVWHVRGQRSEVNAQPEFQAAASQAFSPSTDNTWQITGSPGAGYSMGNGSMSTQLIVDRIGPDGTAFMRYQHPVGKTMAQEAIVLTLSPNGAQFSGLERISIIKEGNPEPRAKVTYQLMGQRQR